MPSIPPCDAAGNLFLLLSPALRNKARHAGLHNDIEPDPLRDFIANLLHGVFGQERRLIPRQRPLSEIDPKSVYGLIRRS